MTSPMPPSYPSPSSAAPGPARPAPLPRSLEAGAGVAWITEGWRIFTAAPWPWIGITVILALIMIAIGFVPVVGMFGHQLLAPVFVGGIILGCHALARGEPLALSHLFDGFKAPHLSPLFVFGLINLAISVAVFALFAMIFVIGVGGAALNELLTGDAIELGTDALLRIGAAGLIAQPLALVGVALLAMLWWFAPPLIVLDGMAPWDAMKASFRGCLVNALPFLLYGIVMTVLAILASIPFALGWIVLAPVAMGSQYASWRQVFSRAP
jgi:uncharacterized membrane protein